MNKIKNSKGITLINVIISVIVISILVTVVTYTGISDYKEAKIAQFIAQMQLIQSKVDELVSKNAYSQIGNNITENQKSVLELAYNNEEISDNSIDYFNQFKYLNVSDLENLDLENIDREVLVNFSTREVVSIAGIEYKNKTYYTQYLLPEGQKLIQGENIERDYELTQDDISILVDGLNCRVSITTPITNGTLDYKDETSNVWTTITNYTKRNEEYFVNITKSGNYSFKLMDNTSQKEELIENVKIVLTNKPKTENEIDSYDYFNLSSIDNWAHVEIELKNYVWIPRFAYRLDTDSNEYEYKFIKGNSNIATDNTYIDESWNVLQLFTKENKELTGIWLEVNLNDELGIEDFIDLDLNTLNTLEEI